MCKFFFSGKDQQSIETFFLFRREKSDGSEDILTCIQVRHAALQFNKRALLSYHFQRLQTLKKFRWEFDRELPDSIKQNLSKEEQLWFNKYCAILGLYTQSIQRLSGGKFDLTLGQKPPKRLYIQVRCIRDYGDYELDDGTIVVLSRGSTHFLQRSNCEKLIQQGYLEQIN